MVEPLYNADLATLLKRARISTADDEQTLALVHQTVTEVRMGFYSKIGKDRATTIASYTLSDNPTTDQEILKASAAATEANWLTWLLAQRLPHLFMDNKASTGDMWNEEQLTRDTQTSKEFLDRLKSHIDEALADLKEPVPDQKGPIKAASIAPDDPCMQYDNFAGLYPLGTETNIGSI